MITQEEWKEYSEYLSELTNDELKIELEWLKSVGIAKSRGSVVAFHQTDTIQ